MIHCTLYVICSGLGCCSITMLLFSPFERRDASGHDSTLAACVLISSFEERVSLQEHHLALFFRIPVLPGTQGVTLHPPASLASPVERPRLHPSHLSLAQRRLPSSPILPPENPPRLLMEKMNPVRRCRQCRPLTNITSSGRTNLCPNLNLTRCLHQ